MFTYLALTWILRKVGAPTEVGAPERRNVRLSRDSLVAEAEGTELGRITLKVQRDGRNVTVEVTSDGEGLVSHAGSA
ncbi:MAG TPA: hypothetical protein VGO80_00605, partial [Solirubrobacteraceae bacterium]|nr:hypothetical protein [Solirubrobacteraceae bacterium]